jgi:AsmA-like C-terminal region
VAKFGAGFLNSLRMNGRFEVTDGHFQKEMQVKANELSARAQGKKVDNPAEAGEVAITSLSADVAIENGIAHLSRLYFEVPGARARVQGTYALKEHQVDLRGNLWTDATVSKDTTGIVSVLLKPIDPLFKRKHAGAMVEVEMNGKIEQPHFGVELTKQKTAWKGAP